MIFIGIVFNSIEFAKTDEVKCDKIDSNYDWYGINGTTNMCFMDKWTSIDAPDVTFSILNDSIGGLILDYNKKIHYLPNLVGENFLNFMCNSAFCCSIKEISSRNFQKMYNLKRLDLNTNEIKKISSETFNDLKNLEELYLS